MEIDQERETILVVDDDLEIRALVKVSWRGQATTLLPPPMEKTG